MAERYFDVAFQHTFFFFFAKVPFGPLIVLSRLIKSSLKSVVVFVSVPERLAGSLSDRWSSLVSGL